MSERADYASNLTYAPGFRARRGLNWGSIGLMYASYYLCRYNFPIANSRIGSEYGLSNAQMGWIISASFIAYAVGQMVNGFFTDRIGGRKAMLTGAMGTIFLNVLFGLASLFAPPGAAQQGFALASFMIIWGLNGYLQSFGAPGMIKINAAWFHKRERGRFAGIFGFMINLGRFAIGVLAPAILGGFMLFWVIQVPPQHWRWTFFVPAAITALITLNFYMWVKETPEEAGYPSPAEEAHGGGPPLAMGELFWLIFSNPVVWITALAYACTGVVRQSVDQWFPKFVEQAYQIDLKSPRFAMLVFGIPLVATAGSLASGYVSDVFFKGRRAPVAAALYLLETVVILSAAWFVNANNVVLFLILIAFTANATHSILGTAAAMDIGGARVAGFASGVIDSFQYYGGFLAGALLGYTIDRFGWGSYFYFMAPFGLIGALLMMSLRLLPPPKQPPPGPPPRGFEVVQTESPAEV
jgi:OPA family glycerol-3-phosphate transporter-like MFS transporter